MTRTRSGRSNLARVKATHRVGIEITADMEREGRASGVSRAIVMFEAWPA